MLSDLTCLTLIVSLATLVHAEQPRLEKVKPLFLETRLIEAGTPRALLVAPADAAYAPAVNKLQAAFREWAGAPLATRDPAAVTTDDLKEFHIVAVGNVPDNGFIERLYRQQFALDTWRPGDDRVAVRSLHNPYNTGRNIVLVGAAGPATIGVAVDVLLARLKHEGRNVGLDGYLIAFEPTRAIPVISEGEKRRADESTRDMVRFDNGRGLISGAAAMANNYARTGAPGYVELFMLFMARHASLKGPGSGTHMNLWDAIVAWDRIEESPLFTDEDRLAIANRLLEVLRSGEGTRYSFFQQGVKQGGVRHNHQTLPGLDAYFGGRYLKTWGLHEEGDEYIEWARKLFVTQSRYHKPMCDCNEYEWTTLYQTAYWAFATDDMTIFDGAEGEPGPPPYRVAADRAMIEVDNLGWSALSGDCWTAWAFPLETLRQAAWRYRDGRYQWMIDKHYGPGKSGVEDLVRGLTPVEPTDLLGIAVAPLDAGFYRLHETTNEPKPNLPLAQCFDKLSMRRSFDPQDEYLLIDGVGMGSHGHFDTNCIADMTARGRTWLVDMSYAEGPNMRDHNALTVTRDGLGGKAPPLARLDAAADLGSFGITQTSVPAYNGLDWRRHVLWSKGRYYLVVDEVEAREEGDYEVRCYWRSLGQPTLAGPDLRVTQQPKAAAGAVAAIAAADASAGKVVRCGAQHARLTWRVKLAAGAWDLAVTARGFTTGDDSLYVHLDGKRVAELSLSRDKLTPAQTRLQIERSGEHEIALTLREAPGCLIDRLDLTRPDGDERLSIEAEDCELARPEESRVDALSLQSAGAQQLSLVRDADNFGKWWADYAYAEPVVNILQESLAERLAVGATRCLANLLVPGPGAPSAPPQRLAAFDRAWTVTGADPGEVTLFALQPGRRLPGIDTDAAALALGPQCLVVRDATRLTCAAISLRADTPVSLEIGVDAAATPPAPAAARVVCQNGATPAAQVGAAPVKLTVGAQTFELKPGRSVLTGLAVGSLTALVKQATEGLRAVGRLAPRAPRFEATRGMTVRWEAKLGSAVLAVVTADLDRSGSRRTVAGCADGTVRLLDDAGKPLWQFTARGKINSVCTADVDGDGKREIIAGADDRKCYCLGRDGAERWSFEGAATDDPYWRRYWKAGEVEKVVAADIDGDHCDEVIFAAANMNLHALDHDGKLLWRFSKYGVMASLITGDLTGDGLPEVIGGPSKITCISEVSVLDRAGTRVGSYGNDGWASALTAVALAELDGPGKPGLLCGTNFNNVFALTNDRGKLSLRWRVPLGDPVTALCGLRRDATGVQSAIAGSSSEYVYCLDPAGKLQWSTRLDGTVLKVTPVSKGPAPDVGLLVVTTQGLYLLDVAGKGVGWHAIAGGVTDADGTDGAVVGTQEGTVWSVALP